MTGAIIITALLAVAVILIRGWLTVDWYRTAHTMPPHPGYIDLWEKHRHYIWRWMKEDMKKLMQTLALIAAAIILLGFVGLWIGD